MLKKLINKLLNIKESKSNNDIASIKFKFIKSSLYIEIQLYDDRFNIEYIDFTEDEFLYHPEDYEYRDAIREIKQYLISMLESKFNTDINNIINLHVGDNPLNVICYYSYEADEIKDVIFKQNKYIDWSNYGR